MNRVDLEASITEKSSVNRKIVSDVIDALLDTVKDTLVKGEVVRIVGFGTLQVQEQAERRGQNPKTGQPITIPARRKVVLKAGKGLKEAVNGR